MSEVTLRRRALVVGATGMQGGAVARAMRRTGMQVCALVRDPTTASAQELALLGIEVVPGDMDDITSLAAVCAGCSTVFSIQPAPFADRDSERRQAANLVGAARHAGVQHMIHTSVSGTGWRSRHPDVDPGEMSNYWDSKEDAEDIVRSAGFPTFTILKPAFFMENFVAPKVSWMFPLLAEGELLVASSPHTEVALVAADDLGAVSASVAADPERCSGVEVELAGDVLTFPAIASVIADVTDRPILANCRLAGDVEARLGKRAWTATQTWFDAVGYPARPEHAVAAGLEVPTTFRQWAETHHRALVDATTPP